ncbi:hypothetical protein OsJ_25124 [Oryza sativa Japonica Group]|uniref:Uncharacterized protein n=1 Tax=Oryza sativa subsp. japonica TaxID=39947 RepID=B9FU81_ORYSJ|nr:hypothetical protein OsJ_25124 [Oryza sativa Japonica Group]
MRWRRAATPISAFSFFFFHFFLLFMVPCHVRRWSNEEWSDGAGMTVRRRGQRHGVSDGSACQGARVSAAVSVWAARRQPYAVVAWHGTACCSPAATRWLQIRPNHILKPQELHGHRLSLFPASPPPPPPWIPPPTAGEPFRRRLTLALLPWDGLRSATSSACSSSSSPQCRPSRWNGGAFWLLQESRLQGSDPIVIRLDASTVNAVLADLFSSVDTLTKSPPLTHEEEDDLVLSLHDIAILILVQCSFIGDDFLINTIGPAGKEKVLGNLYDGTPVMISTSLLLFFYLIIQLRWLMKRGGGAPASLPRLSSTGILDLST